MSSSSAGGSMAPEDLTRIVGYVGWIRTTRAIAEACLEQDAKLQPAFEDVDAVAVTVLASEDPKHILPLIKHAKIAMHRAKDSGQLHVQLVDHDRVDAVTFQGLLRVDTGHVQLEVIGKQPLQLVGRVLPEPVHVHIRDGRRSRPLVCCCGGGEQPCP